MSGWWMRWVPGLAGALARIEQLESRLAQSNTLYDGAMRRVVELQALLTQAQEGEREARREAMDSVKKIADWEARSLGRKPIFDQAAPEVPRPPIQMPAPTMRGRELRARTMGKWGEWVAEMEKEAQKAKASPKPEPEGE